jgi:hypothetical protein
MSKASFVQKAGSKKTLQLNAYNMTIQQGQLAQ